MKLCHWAIIFVIIVLPFSLICRNLINNRFSALKDEVRINNAVDTATQDAIDEIIEIAEEFNYGKDIPITKSMASSAIDRFFTTMSVNFNMPYTAESKAYLCDYIPAIVIVGYDGFYIYSAEETANGIEHKLKSKIPYSYEDNEGNIINFTLDSKITIYLKGVSTDKKVFTGRLDDAKSYIKEVDEFGQYIIDEETGEYKIKKDSDGNPMAEYKYKSEYDEYIKALKDAEIISTNEIINNLYNLTDNLSVILYAFQERKGMTFDDFLFGENSQPLKDYTYDEFGELLSDAGLFHQKRREIIVSTITSALEEEVRQHNFYADMLGINYKFSIPDISKAEWNNTIDDVSFLAFIQGMPMGYDSYYNNYALGGSRIVKTSYIYATIDGLYHSSYCSEVLPRAIDTENYLEYNEENVKDIFMNKRQAASSGYYPCLVCATRRP